MPDLPEHAACEARFEVDVIRELARTRKRDAAFRGRHKLRVMRGELVRERRFEAARAGREKTFGHRNSRRLVSTSAA